MIALTTRSLLVAAIVVGCAEPGASPPVVESRYVADLIDGFPLPGEFASAGTVHFFLERMSVEFERGGHAAQTQTIRSVDETSRQLHLTTTRTTFDVGTRGDTVVLLPRCTGTARSCIAPSKLVPVGAGYQLVISYVPLHTLTLVRH